jgi:ATP-dependent DNA helicase DinG
VSLAPSTILAPDGPVARRLGAGFESRPEQARMVEAVDRAMRERSHLLVEAGTGTGKSFAYLVPALIRAAVHGEVVVVSTHTIALQEQLIERDIPLLIAALEECAASLGLSFAGGEHAGTSDDDGGDEASHQDPGEFEREQADAPESAGEWHASDGEPAPSSAASTVLRRIKAVLVKGRGNYVSIRRLRLASQRQDRLFADPAARRSLHVIEDWAYQTEDGTLSSLPQIERPGVWDKVQSDSGNCMGRRCPTYRECFYQRARRRLEGANILVCNHALFFSDLALRGQDAGFLPRYQHVVLDEAHTVEEVAAEHFGLSMSEGRISHLLATLYQPRTGKGYLPQLSLGVGDISMVDRATVLVEQAQEACRVFFDDLLDAAWRPPTAHEGEGPVGPDWTREAGPRADSGTVRIRAPGVVRNTISPVMRELSMRLKALKDVARDDADTFELNAYAIRAEMVASEAHALVDQALRGCAYWVEATGGGDGGGNGYEAPTSRAQRFRRVTLACAPIDVAPLLKQHLFTNEHSVILTSATLATRTVRDHETTEASETAFAHAMSRLGCEGSRTLQMGSPFDYPRQARLYVDHLATRRERGESESEALARRVLFHTRETRGGAFVLFTSLAMLDRVASLLAGPLSREGLPLLAQGRDGSRASILARFRQDESSVLFGAASFWQGVDVRGRGLRNVIITRLPFEPPDRPLTQARAEVIEARRGNPFMEDALPRAVIRFKQGFGRLIRSASDEGRVVVLDPRIVTARYGRVFLDALPKGMNPIEIT